MLTEELPVTPEILDRLCNLIFDTDTKAVVFVGETGSGKTTLVPPALYLRLTAPFKEIVVLMPTRISTVAAATYVAKLMGVQLGGLVGYRTGFEKNYSRDTKVFFETVAYELALQLNSERQGLIVVMDELHNYSEPQVVVLAWLQREINRRNDMKLVTMSATIDADTVSTYLGNCPVITVPGRSFPVTWHTAKDAAGTTAYLLSQGKNVQLFVEGKAQIKEMTAIVSAMINGKAEFLPLHSELTVEDQERVFSNYPLPRCVISTNAGESSITIPNNHAVVSNGRVRTMTVIDGIKTLIVTDTPQDSMKQQAGRAGRQINGEFWDCSGKPFRKRPKYQVPEIQRVPLGQVILKLAAVDVVASDLNFLHLPNPQNIKLAVERLKSLGALESKGKITEIGLLMSRLPAEVQIARMVVEAQRLGVLEQVVTIAACVEAKGVRDFANENSPFSGVDDRDNWKALTAEDRSDLLAELDCYLRAERMTPDERLVAGIHEKRFLRAVEIRDHLVRALRSVDIEVVSTNTDRNEVLRACVAGLQDHVYRPIGNGQYVNGSGSPRQLAHGNVIEEAGKNLIVGIPFGLEVARKHKGQKVPKMEMVDLILFPSIVPKDWVRSPVSKKLRSSRAPRTQQRPRQAIRAST